jgi:hypothetical protein
MKKNVIISDPRPNIGMGGTIYHHSDRTPITIIKVSANGYKIYIQEDKSKRTDNNGMDESQLYEYEADTNGVVYIATLRKDGYYRLVGSRQRVALGIRRKYHDYSF